VSTRLGGAVAVAAVALLGKLSWGARIGLIVLVVLLVVGYELWSRRAQIADEIAAEQANQQAEPPAPDAGAPTPPGAPS
jgi:type VI protein secretion system component VasK